MDIYKLAGDPLAARDLHRRTIQALANLSLVLKNGDTLSESAAWLVSHMKTHEDALSYLHNTHFVLNETLRQLAALTRLEAHERGLTNANHKSERPAQ